MKSNWKLWILLLSIVSIALLLWVIKLIFDKSTRDQAKAEATEYLSEVEILLESQTERDSETAWKFRVNGEDQGPVGKFALMQNEQVSTDVLGRLKRNVSQRLLEWKTLNRSSVLGQKIRTILGLPLYLVSKPQAARAEALKSRILEVQTEERLRVRLTSQSTPSLYPLPKFTKSCHHSKILSVAEWTAYYNGVGARVKPSDYVEYMEILNEDALQAKFPSPIDYAVQTTFDLSASKMLELLNTLWIQIKPLYLEVHAYLRGELRFLWSVEGIPKSGPIPAHMLELLGDCSVVLESTKPHPLTVDGNLTQELSRGRYTPRAMATYADDFLSSLGFPMATVSFWTDSIFQRKAFWQNFNCTPQLFRLGREFRISLCGESDERTLTNVNELLVKATLGSILWNESVIIRNFVNLPLRSGIEQGLLLGMRSVSYLRRLGIPVEFPQDASAKLNSLYREAFQVLPEITKALTYYRWSYDVNHLKMKPSEYSNHYWKLRLGYEGVAPKDARTSDSNMFDPAVNPNLVQSPAENLVPIVTSLIKYATYESLCTLASLDDNRTENNCDFFARPAVGARLVTLVRSTLQSPMKAFETIFDSTRNSTLDATALLNYFQPLMTYLGETNKRRELPVGW